jgi:hypothetical protein
VANPLPQGLAVGFDAGPVSTAGGLINPGLPLDGMLSAVSKADSS